jgi:hypothetical protein
MGRAGKQVIWEDSDEDDVPLAQRKRKVAWAQVLKDHVSVVALIHQLLLVAPLAKVIVPAPS